MKLFPFTHYKIYGHSMLPTLKKGQEVLCFNWAYLFKKPKVGEIVVVKVNSKELVKRIQIFSDRGIFVTGDNPQDSLDSRKFGPIKKSDIIGKVITGIKMENVNLSNPEGLKGPKNWLKISGRSVASIKHPARNEDTIAHSSQKGFAMVLDGVGGLAAGDAASRLARDTLGENLGIIGDSDPRVINQKLSKALVEVSDKVFQEVQGGGTTATVVKFFESGNRKYAVVGSVGDSRAYLYREGKLVQITDDDSWVSGSFAQKKSIREKLGQVASQQDLTRLTKQEKVFFARRNIITQMLGQERPPKPHIHGVTLQSGDKIILTTDGVHDNLTKTEIEELVKMGQGDLANLLVDKAKARSSDRSHIRAKPDDASAIVIDIKKPQLGNIANKPKES